MKQIWFCDGGKGGVGKSLIASALTDLLLQQSEDVVCVEADATNPDVARHYQNTLRVLLADLTDHDGWMSLLEAIEVLPAEHVVVSLAAGLSRQVEERDFLAQAFPALGYAVNQLFCINRQPDSLVLAELSLLKGLGSIAQKAAVIKNGFYGSPIQFERWDDSELRTTWRNKGFRELYVPELHYRVLDWIDTRNLPFHAALEMRDMPLVLRLELQQWLNKVALALVPFVTPSESTLEVDAPGRALA